ncbi:MAG: hypothetical protein H0X38_00270 [Planctomycetes bacterium]|nr:hypothetical protein [Planctomycetota bacterium]
MRALFCLAFMTSAIALAAQDAPPAGVPPSVAKPVETSPTRGEMALDGAWRFAPAAKDAPAQCWGWIAVPGSWRDERSLFARGDGALWWDLGDEPARSSIW